MLAAGSFGIDSVNLTPRVAAIISRWIFPVHPGVVPQMRRETGKHAICRCPNNTPLRRGVGRWPSGE
ncbi:hypothetical protein PI125_g10545 [Phytophthora idaei]|nr:hypothetical protein PI125_g10545 [Phytophthora idaei]